MTNFTTTITQKGQITLPQHIRLALKLNQGDKVELSVVDKKKKQVQIKPLPDIMELAGRFKVKKAIDPVKIREYMETHYKRV
jgi:AbrB family looped-hinge helix DNA binding protein